MGNSTKTATSPKVKAPSVRPGANYDEVMHHIADLSERINFVMETMQSHAAEIQAQGQLLDRIRIRMGL